MEGYFKITRVKREAYFHMEKAHFHDYYEIYYLYSGRRKFFINDTIYNINKGEFILLKRGDLHQTTFDSNQTHERCVINFTSNYLNNLFQTFDRSTIMSCFAFPHIHIPYSRRDYVEELLFHLLQEHSQDDDFSKYLKQKHFEELIIFLIRYQEYVNHNKEDITVEDETIQSAARYICKNYDKEIMLEQTAATFGMSPTYFSKKFKKITGFGFKEYLIHVRLKEACELLLNTDEAITEIALKCGFNDSNYFGDTFKRVKGIPPSRYRKNKELI